MLIEGSGFGDSLYMTLITINTVGYGETINPGPAATMFIGYILVVLGDHNRVLRY